MVDSSSPSADIIASLGRLQSLLLTTPDTITFLQQLATLSAELVEPAISCGITIRHDGQPLTAVSSDDRAALLDETQYQAAEGPCLYTLDTGEITDMADVEHDQRWPSYVTLARRAGLRCSLSLPLMVQGATLGAMNVYAFERAHALDGERRQRLEVFAGQASGALQLASAQHQERAVQEQLEAALTSRSVIDQAMGIVMGQQRCTAEQAFALLRMRSQNSQTKLRDVAAELVQRVSGHSPEQGRPFD